MKLKLRGSTKAAGTSRRKRRQLLLEPPPSPQCSPSLPTDDLARDDCDEFDGRKTDDSDRRKSFSSSSENWKTRDNKSVHQQARSSMIQQQQQPQQPQQQQSGRRRLEDLRHLDNCPRGHSQDNQQQQQQQRWRGNSMQNANMATTKTRCKSELTSFLTILFGSMLALVLLSATANRPRLIMCGDSSATSPNSAGMTAATRTGNITAATSRRNMSSPLTGSTHGTRLKELEGSAQESPPAETEILLTPSSRIGSEGNSTDLDYEDEGELGGKSNKTRLGDLITDTASNGADLIINRLRASSEPDPSPADDSSESSESDEDNQLDQGDKQTTNSATANATASPQLAPQNTTTTTTLEQEAESLRQTLEVYAKWRSTADDVIELFSKKLLPIIMEHGYDVDSGTVAGMLQVFNGIRQLKPWSLKILDAWFKLAPGLLAGTQSDFGDFDECLNIRVDDPSGLAAASSEFFSEVDPETGLKTSTLVGRYCLADVEFPKPPRRAKANDSLSMTGAYEPIELRTPLLDFNQLPAFKGTIFVETGNFLHMLYVDPVRVGVCLTNKIDPLSFQQVANKLLEEFKITVNFQGRCVTKYDRPVWSIYQQVSAYILVAACSLLLLSTLLDVLHAKLNKLPCSWKGGPRLQLLLMKHRPLFTSFSLIRNTKRLFEPSNIQTAHSSTRSAQVLASYPHELALGSSSSCAASSTTSSLAECSVESSPTIERRSSADTTTSSTKDLISTGSPAGSSCGRVEQHKFSMVGQTFDPAQLRKSAASEKHTQHHQHHSMGQVSLASLHGIRVITMIWMIVNHTYMFGGFFVLWARRRLIDIAEWPKSLSFQVVLNGWLTVETYFFLSALIIVLNVLPLMRARKFSYFGYVLHRLLRLLPAYVGLVCLNFLWPLVSSGPVWLVKGRSFVQEPCERYLWTNFLFINNWIWPEKQCMVHTWFLSADFQLYILAPIIVYLLYRRPALGHSLNLLVALVASALSGFVIYANKLLPTTLINKLEFDAIKQQLSYSYFATYQHMGPYCLGILTGYLLHKRPHARLPKHLSWALWLLLPPLSFTTLLLTYLWNGAYSEPQMINPSPLVSALYVAIHRTIWTALVAWLVFACSTGRAKLLSSFLSHSIFLPVSRLSYSIYLVHLPVIMFRAMNLRHTLEWSDQNILWEACGNFVASLFIGFFLKVAFESPIINLEGVLWRRRPAAALTGNNSAAAASINKQIYQTNKLTLVGASMKPEAGSASSTGSDNGHSSEGTAATGGSSSEQERLASGKDSNAIVGPGALSTSLHEEQRRSLRPKQSAANSVECVLAPAKVITGHAQLDVDEASEHRSSASSSIQSLEQANASILSQQQQQQRRPLNNSKLQLHLSLANPQRQEQEMGDEDDLYNITAEYRRYAPAGYQQWRRAKNSPHHSNSASVRPQQYATLARTNRLHQDPTVLLATRRNHLHLQQQQQQQQQQLDNYERYQQARISSGYSAANLARHPTHMTPHHSRQHEQLFPNVSELGYGAQSPEDARLMSQRRHLSPPHRHQRQGRYNTLTGTGARDWRSQLVASRNHQAFQQDDEQTASQLRSWSQPNEQQQHLAWLPSEMGSLLIPRIDSSNLRRQPRPGGGSTSSSLLGATRHLQEDSKIVEEPAGEANENSAL